MVLKKISAAKTRKLSKPVSTREILFVPISSQNLLKIKKTILDKKSNDDTLLVLHSSKTLSKFIGETEKNLQLLFRKIKDKNGILLFDEADALFGKRTKVQSSNSKFANIEISFLLKRLQNYRGLLLTTPNFRKPTTREYLAKLDFILFLSLKKDD